MCADNNNSTAFSKKPSPTTASNSQNSARYGAIPASLVGYLSTANPAFSALPLKQQAAIAVYIFNSGGKRYRHSKYDDAQCLFWQDLRRVFRANWHVVNAQLGGWFQEIAGARPGVAKAWKISDAAYELLENWAFGDFVECKMIDFQGKPVKKPRTAISQMTADGKKSRFRGSPVRAYIPVDGDNIFQLIKQCHAWQERRPALPGFAWAQAEWDDREAAKGRRTAALRVREVLLTASKMLHVSGASGGRGFSVATTYVEAESGRLYPNGLSLAGCAREVKRAALHGCWEYDGENMHWQLLYKLAKRAALEQGKMIELPEIKKYLEFKNAYRSRVALSGGLVAAYGQKLGIEKAKEVLIALIFGASAKSEDPKHRIPEIVGAAHLPALRAELVGLCRDMAKARALVLASYKASSRKVHRSKKLVNAAGRTYTPDAGETNLSAKELAHILQGLESEILLACIEHAGESIVLLQHDGFTTDKKLDKTALIEAIEKRVGMQIEVSETQL